VSYHKKIASVFCEPQCRMSKLTEKNFYFQHINLGYSLYALFRYAPKILRSILSRVIKVNFSPVIVNYQHKQQKLINYIEYACIHTVCVWTRRSLTVWSVMINECRRETSVISRPLVNEVTVNSLFLLCHRRSKAMFAENTPMPLAPDD